MYPLKNMAHDNIHSKQDKNLVVLDYLVQWNYY